MCGVEREDGGVFLIGALGLVFCWEIEVGGEPVVGFDVELNGEACVFGMGLLVDDISWWGLSGVVGWAFAHGLLHAEEDVLAADLPVFGSGDGLELACGGAVLEDVLVVVGLG